MPTSKQLKKKRLAAQKLSKGRRAPSYVKVRRQKKNLGIAFPVASHRVERRIMLFSLIVSSCCFTGYYVTKPASALFTEEAILYQSALLLVSLFAGVKFLNQLMTRMYINIGKAGVHFYYGPLIRRKAKRLYSQRISQIYVERKESFLGFRYNVLAMTRNGKSHIIFKTYQSDLAKYVEQMIETQLGIKNVPVAGEYDGIKEDYYL